MSVKWAVAGLVIMLFCGGTAPMYEGLPVTYPVITGVRITAPDGRELDPVDAIVLEEGKEYVLTATVETDAELQEDWQLSWGSNHGEFPEQPQTGNGVEWTAPEEAGEVIFQVRLTGEVEGEEAVYEKSFRVQVGDADRPDFAPGVVVIMFQEWCGEDCVESWAGIPPAAGVDRQVSPHLNVWRVRLEPEEDVMDAVREITWWPCVRVCEPDLTLTIFREGIE